MNLAAKYRPQTFEDVMEQSAVVDILKKICSEKELTNRNFLFIGPAGTGKAQPLYSRVLTPEGFITMGEVEVGTEVITHTGAKAKVSGVYPQGVRPVYEILLDDYSSIRVSDEHLNLIHVYNIAAEKHFESVLTTLDVIELFHHPDEYTLYIDSPKNVMLPEGKLLPNSRQIISIMQAKDDICQCIMVDHPDHTYISDGFIPTHNTTLGRIISKHLNSGSSNGIIEIDAASHSGADAARDLTNQARAYPVGTAWKCFIVDECHAISSQGWQVLLKTLEENPAKSIFILCTTNPEKIPATILSRVQTFRLSKISIDGITARLKHICDSEIAEGAELTYEDDALKYIAKLGNGGMRDSIQLLDRAIAYSKDVTIDNLATALDLPNYDNYFDLLQSVTKKDNAEIVRIINDVYDSGTNFVKWFEGFHSFVCQIVKYIYLKDITKTMIPAYYQDKISKYGSTHAVLCLRLANVLITLNHALKSTNYLQEVAMTYLCSSAKR